MVLTIAMDGPVGAGKKQRGRRGCQTVGHSASGYGSDVSRLRVAGAEGRHRYEQRPQALAALAERTMPEVRFENGAQRTLIGGTDVTDCIRTPEISMAASVVSTVPQVRRAMVARQQELAQRQSMLLDGRDIGTRVLPNATLKIYLTASAEGAGAPVGLRN